MKRVGIIVAAGVALGVAVLLCMLGAGETAGALSNWQALVLAPFRACGAPASRRRAT